MKVKSLQKQLMAAIAMVLVAAIALSSATYAWFVNNAKVTATGANVQAATAYSLLISNDKTTWGTTTEFDTLLTTLTPVSTVGEIAAAEIELKKKAEGVEPVGIADGTKVAVGDVRFVTNTGWKDNFITTVSEVSKSSTVGTAKENTTNTYFYSDTVYLKAAQAGKIYLDSTGIGIVWAKYDASKDSKFAEAELVSLAEFAELDAIDVTSLNDGTTPTLAVATEYNENLASAQALLKTLRVGLLITQTGDETTRVWHEYQLDAETFAADTVNTTASGNNSANGILQAVSAKTGVSADDSATDSAPYVTTISGAKMSEGTIESYALVGETNALVQASSNSKADLLATVTANEVVTVDVYIWMEGCDFDTVAAHINDFAGTGVSGLQFGFCLAE